MSVKIIETEFRKKKIKFENSFVRRLCSLLHTGGKTAGLHLYQCRNISAVNRDNFGYCLYTINWSNCSLISYALINKTKYLEDNNKI